MADQHGAGYKQCLLVRRVYSIAKYNLGIVWPPRGITAEAIRGGATLTIRGLLIWLKGQWADFPSVDVFRNHRTLYGAVIDIHTWLEQTQPPSDLERRTYQWLLREPWKPYATLTKAGAPPEGKEAAGMTKTAVSVKAAQVKAFKDKALREAGQAQ